MSVKFDGRVAVVTGAGAGLGRCYALQLAARGAKVMVNDFGGTLDGSGSSAGVAEAVAEEIRSGGGEALSHGADVTDAEQVSDMIGRVHDAWGRVDILMNNAGILRDASFVKMSLDDFRKVIEVHVMGSVVCTKAVWPLMREAKYGRVMMTSSPSGLYGNFGQANYSAAKMAVVGLMNTLQIEGEKYGIHVNTLAPGAATRMTEGILSPQIMDYMTPEAVAPAALYLVSEEAPRRVILNAGAGGYSRTLIHETEGIYLSADARSPEAIAAHFSEISDETGQHLYTEGVAQVMKFVGKAMAEGGA